LIALYKANSENIVKRIEIIMQCLRNLGVLPIFLCNTELLEVNKKTSFKVLELIYCYLNERIGLSFPDTIEELIEPLNKQYYQKLIKICLN